MALSSPSQQQRTTVYGLDSDTWIAFRAWCIARRLSPGDQAAAALRAWMAAPKPSDTETGND